LISLEVPSELADALIAEQLAAGRYGPRGPAAEIVVDGFSAAATVISLFQGPETFINLARLLKDAVARRGSGDVKVSVKGPRGKVEFVLREDTDLKALSKLLKDGLVGDPK
jgi:hypothetical protein